MIGAMLSIFSGFLGSIFGNIMKTKVIFISTVSGAIVNAIAAQFLIKLLGVNGASISLILGFIITILLRVLLLRKYINLQINIRFLFVSIILTAIYVYVYNLNLIFNFIALIFSIVFIVICFRKEFISIIKIMKPKRVAR
jgi:O-antigen/teichoic acid export membrane protein